MGMDKLGLQKSGSSQSGSKMNILQMKRAGGIKLGELEQKFEILERVYQEINLLGENLGIEVSQEFEKYGWLLINMIMQNLPEKWMKEVDLEGRITYYNSENYVTLRSHPGMQSFRLIFDDFLSQLE